MYDFTYGGNVVFYSVFFLSEKMTVLNNGVGIFVALFG